MSVGVSVGVSVSNNEGCMLGALERDGDEDTKTLGELDTDGKDELSVVGPDDTEG